MRSLCTAHRQVAVNNAFAGDCMSPAKIKRTYIHVNCLIFLPDFNQIWIFPTKITEIRPVGETCRNYYSVSRLYAKAPKTSPNVSK